MEELVIVDRGVDDVVERTGVEVTELGEDDGVEGLAPSKQKDSGVSAVTSLQLFFISLQDGLSENGALNSLANSSQHLPFATASAQVSSSPFADFSATQDRQSRYVPVSFAHS
jgi:hypothetical protein